MSIFNKNNITPDTNFLLRDIERLFITQDIIKSLSSKQSFEEIATVILNEIEKKMGYTAASISLINEEANTIQLKYLSDSLLSKLSKKFLLGDKAFREISLTDQEETLTKLAAKERRVIFDKDISKFISPPLKKTTAEIIQRLGGIKCMVAFPIMSRDKVIGVLNFSMNQNIEEIRTNEKKTLELFIDQVGLIIDNVQKYQEIREFNIQLKKEIDKATADLKLELKNTQSLYHLTSNVSRSLDPDTVAQIAVDSLPQDQSMIGAILARFDKKTNTIKVKALTNNDIAYEAGKILGDFYKYVIDLNDHSFDNNITAITVRTGEVHFSEKLEDLISPPVPKALVGPISKILNIKSVVVYPVLSGDEVIGTIAYLLKDRNYADMAENERQLYATYTFQIAIALQNADLFRLNQIIQANLDKALKKVQLLRQYEQEMLDIMGHELRTPLTIVRNALSFMDMQLQMHGSMTPEIQRKYVDMGLESTRREVKLVETLLSSAKANSRGFQLTLESVDVDDVIHDSLLAFKREGEKKGLQVNYTKPEKPLFAYADRARTQEIFDNFVSNAVKYTDKGSIDIWMEEKDDMIWLHVKDTGQGISEEDMKKLGKKFYRVDQYDEEDSKPKPIAGEEEDIKVEKLEKKDNEFTENFKAMIVRPGGTGLGLYVTFILIEIMEGQKEIVSKLGEGSRFSFGLPKFNGQKMIQVQRKSKQQIQEEKELEPLPVPTL